MLVAVYHAVPVFSKGQAAAFIELFGFAGVDIFFVISGFVLVWTAPETVHCTNNLKFLYNRLARIFLGYWPYFMLAFALWYLLDRQMLEQKAWLGSLLLLPLSLSERLLPVSWSLTYELYFYFVLFLILFVPRRLKLAVLVMACVLMVALAAWMSWVYKGYQPDTFKQLAHTYRVLVSPFALEFFAGGILACINLERFKQYGMGILIAACLLFVAGIGFNHYSLNGNMAAGYHVVNRVMFFGSAAVCLVLAFLLYEARGIQFWPAVARVVGGASYSIYLSHTLIIQAWVAWGGIAGLSGLLISLTSVLLYSYLHYRCLEKPLYTAAKVTVKTA